MEVSGEGVHFGFNYDELFKGSYHFDFPGALTLSLLDQALKEFWEDAWNFNPEYLFVAKQDYRAIAEQVIQEPKRVSETLKAMAEQVMGGSERMSEVENPIQAYYLNQTTGRLISLVATPGLKAGSVIMGFSKCLIRVSCEEG